MESPFNLIEISEKKLQMIEKNIKLIGRIIYYFKLKLNKLDN